ncbi:hypothetical protein [Streptomyces sp. EN23]|uniref:hypothetical protein n=1 Tax=Streptomyces sp. EN23 TaxID=212774 RepID=UPI000851A848|nr:hypothetical protein [Streptomyces sp. EN23]
MPELSRLLPLLTAGELLPSNPVAVFCGGPAARGWPDPATAHDIRVVTRTPWSPPSAVNRRVPLDPSVVGGITLLLDGRRSVVTYWTECQVDQVLAKTTRERLAAVKAAPLLVEAEELLVENLLTGQALSGTEWVSDRRGRAEASAFQDITVTRSLGDAEGSIEDTLGQLASGDLHSAVLSARKAFGHAVDAMLESHGGYGTCTPELRARRFREVAPSIMDFDTYWAVECLRDLRADDPRSWVESVLETCRELVAAHPGELRSAALRGPRRGW